MIARIPSAAVFRSAPRAASTRAKLHAGRFLRDEKASSGLPLQPTDLPSLLTEQIAHFSPLLRDDAIPDGFVFLAGTMEPSPALPICFVAKGGLPQKPC